MNRQSATSSALIAAQAAEIARLKVDLTTLMDRIDALNLLRIKELVARSPGARAFFTGLSSSPPPKSLDGVAPSSG